MRKLTTVLALWLCALSSTFAQSVFPTQDAIWEESTFTIAGQFIRYRLLCGDTTISANSYAKIYDMVYPFDGEEISTDTVPPKQYAGSLRVVEDQVFFVPPGTTEDLLLYDFSLEPESSFELPNITFGNAGTYNVSSVDTLMINGQQRRRLFLENVFGQTEDVWIEGIGSIRYGLLDRGLGLVFDYGSALQCMQFTADGFTFRSDPNGPCNMVVTGCGLLSPVYDHSAYAGQISIFPNPIRGSARIQVPQDGSQWQMELWSLEGRLVEKRSNISENLDWSYLAQGAYWLKIFRDGQYVYHEKLILQ